MKEVIDGVYRAPDGSYVILEGKYTGSASLNAADEATGLASAGARELGIYFEEAPQIKDNKLYILDSSQTLHIFERE